MGIHCKVRIRHRCGHTVDYEVRQNTGGTSQAVQAFAFNCHTLALELCNECKQDAGKPVGGVILPFGRK